MLRRVTVLVASSVLAVGLTGCAGQDAPSPAASAAAGPRSAPPSLSPSEDSASTTTPSPTAAASPTPSARVVDVALAGGVVTGVEPRVEVDLGEQVLIRVTSDVAEEVHVHGYDVSVVLPAGGTAELPFTADIPGGFEVELEGSGKLLFQLRVA